MAYETQQYIYRSIAFMFNGSIVEISQWCRAGLEVFEVETLGM